VFGSTLGLLVFVYYAARFVLFGMAWATTSRVNQSGSTGIHDEFDLSMLRCHKASAPTCRAPPSCFGGAADRHLLIGGLGHCGAHPPP